MRQGAIDWQAKVVTLPGETECGDQFAVLEGAAGLLVAAIDGVGHGANAALAGKTAVSCLEACRNDTSVDSIVRKCHEHLQQTRGVALSLAVFEQNKPKLTWVGVGNVAGVLLRDGPGHTRRMESLVLKSGVVGKQLPSLFAATLALNRGDLLLFATDGINRTFADAVNVKSPLEKTVQDVIAGYRTGDDDALVLGARYMG
jgi:negative regulator of sigma-B (phosphoserine phosphatase)